MPSHIDTGSKADKAAAAQGRKFKGRIYSTVAQKLAAQKAASSYSVSSAGPSGTQRVSGPNQTAGWVSSVVVQEVSCVLSNAGGYHNVGLLGTGGVTNVVGVQDQHNVKIQGIRLEVNMPFATTKARWAVGLATAVSAGDKTPSQVVGLSGAVGGHDSSVIDGWYTLNVSNDLLVLKKEGQSVAPNLLLLASFQNVAVTGSTERITIRVHVTVLKPGGVSTVHVI